MTRPSKKEQFVLAAMAPAGTKPFTPVQIQKLFFILDNTISSVFAGPHFNFIPYDYGPFDKEVYRVLEQLETKGLVESKIHDNFNTRAYRLTDNGLNLAKETFSNLPQDAQSYIEKLVQWIRSISFSQLISWVYKSFPEMRENSIFQGIRS